MEKLKRRMVNDTINREHLAKNVEGMTPKDKFITMRSVVECQSLMTEMLNPSMSAEVMEPKSTVFMLRMNERKRKVDSASTKRKLNCLVDEMIEVLMLYAAKLVKEIAGRKKQG